MQSSIVELMLPLGDLLTSEIEQRATRMNVTPGEWLTIFLANGRLTPDVAEELSEAKREGLLFLPTRR